MAQEKINQAKRNPWALIGCAMAWCFAIWLVGLFLIGFSIGATHPENAATESAHWGAIMSLPVLLASALLSTTLTILGVLPGSHRKPAAIPTSPALAVGLDLDALERLGVLHRQGVLTDEEFAAQKAVVLSRSTR